MAIHIQPREFITLLTGAMPWPLAARTQPSAMPTIEFFNAAPPKGFAPMVAASNQGRKEVGFVALIAFLSFSLICTALAQQRPGRIDVPIVIGGDKEFDACAGTGEVIGLDSKGDGFLSVQSGPDRPYREIDRLFNGNKVYICDQRGLWYAVIYSESHELTPECGVGKPWQTRQAYTGPCRYGWAAVHYIRTTSGFVR